jgi:hypothetical protein
MPKFYLAALPVLGPPAQILAAPHPHLTVNLPYPLTLLLFPDGLIIDMPDTLYILPYEGPLETQIPMILENFLLTPLTSYIGKFATSLLLAVNNPYSLLQMKKAFFVL